MNTRTIIKFILFFILSVTTFSCNDEYIFLEKDPVNVDGRSLYAILKGDNRFDVYVEMLQHTDSAYIEILNRTGSRTLFVPTDDAFEQFFQNNPYGIKSVKDMSNTLIKIFLSYYTLENAYVESALGSSKGSEGAPTEGNCLRRYTTFLSTDTIPYTNIYPDNAQFKRFQGKSIYLTTPGRWTLLNFTQPYLDKKFMANEDFNTLFPGSARQKGETYIFGAKITTKDIRGMNGYIHVLNKVVLPPKNMYETIRDMEDVSIFRELLERFCEPVYDRATTLALRELKPEVTDSVFYIDFFDTPNRVIIDNYGNEFKVDPLPFSPSKNGEQAKESSAGGVPSDMPVMFIPTDRAMNEYLSSSYLKDYGNWKNVPNDIVVKFVRTHMKNSFINSYPSLLKDIVDDAQGDLMFPAFNYTDDVKMSTVCRNGLVYTMNRVVAPRDFSTVVAPIMNNPNTKITNWLINQSYNNAALKYNYYLTSLENKFTLFIPYDDAFLDYPDPLSQTSNTTIKRLMKFKYDETMKGVNFIYCNMNGDSIGAPAKPNFNDSKNATLLTIQNRLQDVMDHHIVVGEIDEGQTYVQTKGGAYIRIIREGRQMKLQGAGNIEKGTYVNVVEAFVDNNHIKNGKVYFIDKRIEHSLTSPLGYGMQHPECGKFYEMLELYNNPDKTFFPNGAVIDSTKRDKENQLIITQNPFNTLVTAKPIQQEYVPPIFSLSDGIDYAVPFLGLYDYTILVPTDDAMLKAEENGLYKTVEEIQAMGNFNDQVREIKKVILFLKNHFVDGAVFTKQYYNNKDRDKYTGWITHTTSAKRTIRRNNVDVKEFNEIEIGKQGETLIIRDKSGQEKARSVQGTENTITHQYRFLNSNIATNSRAVVCQINNVLTINE